MSEYGQRLLEYDLAAPEARKALLESWFSDKDMKRLFRTIAENSVIRALLEFRCLGVVPFEDYKKLERKGLIDCRSSFRTYVAVARGYKFPDVRLTPKGERMSVQGRRNSAAKQLTVELFRAYRFRASGKGVVANREVLEQWLEDGDEECLSLLADPQSGDVLEHSVSENVDFFAELCDPHDRPRLMRERSKNQVAIPFTESDRIHYLKD